MSIAMLTRMGNGQEGVIFMHEKMKMSIAVLTKTREGLWEKNWGKNPSCLNNRDIIVIKRSVHLIKYTAFINNNYETCVET